MEEKNAERKGEGGKTDAGEGMTKIYFSQMFTIFQNKSALSNLCAYNF